MRARVCVKTYMCLQRPEVWNPLEVAATANHHVSTVKGAQPGVNGVYSELLTVSLLQSANKSIEFRCGWLPSSVFGEIISLGGAKSW